MAVSIRLRRMGRKKQPHYRIVVAESEHPRDGRFVESLGFYKPLSQPARLVIDLDRVDHWLGQGAQPSGTVKSLIGKARSGGDETVALGELNVRTEKAKRSEELAERRAGEKRKEQAATERPLTQVPQDTSESPGGSSSADVTAAEAMATTEAEAVRDAEDSEPNAPRESIVRSSAETEGAVRPKRKPKVAGAEGEEEA
jgi:small subunit ribosomal protein S16